MLRIVDLALQSSLKELQERNVQVTFSEKAKEFLVDKGYDPTYGARQVRRTVRKYVEDPIAEELLKNRFPSGAKILVRCKDDGLEFVDAESVKKKVDHPKPVKPQDSN